MSSLYISEQNNRAECFNKTVIRSVRFILYKKKRLKSCWEKIACRVIYTLNWTLFKDDFKSAFKYLQGKKSHLSHLKILECHVWVHILKETWKKLNECTWQRIHVRYDFTNWYYILNIHISKVHIAQDVHFNKLHTYKKKRLLSVNFKNEKWASCYAKRWSPIESAL